MASDDRPLPFVGLLGTSPAGANMGIYDREYYRGETQGSGWISGIAPACKMIVIINVVVFFLQQTVPHQFVNDWFAASTTGIFQQGRIWQLLTATFLHSDPFHILFNMLFFWALGR